MDKYDAFQLKLWNALNFKINNMDKYDAFQLKLAAKCQWNDLEKLEIFWFVYIEIF